jgi:hypothetical protein
MIRIIVAYVLSLAVLIIAFTIVYINVFESVNDGYFSDKKWDSGIMDFAYYPTIGAIGLFHFLLFGLFMTPLIWLMSKKLKHKKLISLLSFLIAGLIVSAITLISIEPIIATDFFEYGERQEYNRALESIGYNYFNALTYISLCISSIFVWATMQFKPKNASL